jgi:plasmid stabilization system protein ParE
VGNRSRESDTGLSRLIVTPGAARGLERCRQFLAQKSPAASRRAAQAIARQFELLTTQPGIGRPLEDEPGLRELIVSFGDSGYVALYRYDQQSDTVLMLAFRHQKEAGY